MSQGRLFVVVGPSGVGKDTLIDGVRACRPDIHIVRRVITRPSDHGGEDYEAVTMAEFDRRSDRQEFALQWQAHDLRYGIPRAQVNLIHEGRDVLFNGSRAALQQTFLLAETVRVIQIAAQPSVVAERLASRQREGAQDIAQRMARSELAAPAGTRVATVVNDATIAEGVERLLSALQPDRGKR